MNSPALVAFHSKSSKIPGWLSYHDAAVIDSILSAQSGNGIEGDLLEIGVYAGRSAVLLGQHLQPREKFHACDIFDEVTDQENSEEILRSYENLSRSRFESNCLEFMGYLPTIHQCLSLELPNILSENVFRFIHIDGSHLFEHVTSDLKYAVSAIDGTSGVIAVDDFRAQHTVGVALAVWKLVLDGVLVPLVMTPAKIYLGKPNISFDLDSLAAKLRSLDVHTVRENIMGFDTLRTVGLADQDLYSKSHGMIEYIPPVITKLLRNSYFWKKLRSR